MSEFVIGRRELYILPTRIGWYYSLILIALFAIAVKFDNQAAFMMLFVLAAVGMVAMLYTHNNVIGISMLSQPARAVFVGETAHFPLLVKNNSSKHRKAVWLICDGYQQLLKLAPNQELEVELALPTLKRGYFSCTEVILTSQFPIGIFFCWSKRHAPNKRCLVYPQPLNILPLPGGDANVVNRRQRLANTANSEDYSGMKPYQAGDRLRDVHWPSLAKTQKLVAIQHQDLSGDAINLSWFSLPQTMPIEDRLSQLCQWVISAEQDNLRYQLELPNHTLQFNTGATHFHQCLTTLALWEGA